MGTEWEYAARAGTRTAFYSGDIMVHPDITTCYPDDSIDAIAWWCNNSGGSTHPVGLKSPNAWGLYDTSGNCAEWIIDHRRGFGYGLLPLTDPGDPIRDHPTRSLRGGPAHLWATAARSASWVVDGSFNAKADGSNVRLVRTILTAERDSGVARDAGKN
jgi:formylglycine-generating enzyme